MSIPAHKVGRQSDPCRDCSKPIGNQGQWYPHPFHGHKPYGRCPSCVQAVWEKMLAQVPPAPPESSRNQLQEGGEA